MKLIKNILILLNLTFSSLAFSQSSKDMIEEFMKMRKEMFDSFFSDSFDSSDFESRVLEMMKEFDQSTALGNWPDIHGISNSTTSKNGWTESDSHRNLEIKVRQIKDKPLDIKIQNGMITVKGQTEEIVGNSKSIVNFQKSYSIPTDVDQTNPEFENSEDKITVKFKKLNPNKIVKKESSKAIVPKKSIIKPKEEKVILPSSEDRVPIGPGDGSLGL